MKEEIGPVTHFTAHLQVLNRLQNEVMFAIKFPG